MYTARHTARSLPPLRTRTLSVLIPLGVIAVTACSDSTNATGPASTLRYYSGNVQADSISSPLPSPLVVMAADANGNPIVNATINWTVSSHGGTLDSAITTTDANGLAQVTWTLGSAAASDTVTATLTGLTPVVFTATTLAGAADSVVKVSGDLQAGAVGTALTDSLDIRVADRFGNPVIGQSVVWAVPVGGGSVSSTTTTTDANGRSAVQWTIGTGVGTANNIALATVNGTLAATFTASGH
jgi:hypothetical protein